MEVVERKIRIGPADALSLFGPSDQFLQLIEQKFDAGIVARGDTVIVHGSPQEVQQIERVFKELTFILGKSGSLSRRDVTTVLDLVTEGEVTSISESDLDTLFSSRTTTRSKPKRLRKRSTTRRSRRMTSCSV